MEGIICCSLTCKLVFYNIYVQPFWWIFAFFAVQVLWICIYTHISIHIHMHISVQFSHSVVSDLAIPWTASCQASISITNSQLTQTHVHWVGDAIQPSHPLSSHFPPTFNLSQYQSLFKWLSSLRQVVKVLGFQLQHQSFQWIVRTDFF